MLPQDRVQRGLFVSLILAVAVSCIQAPYRQFLLMQHVPTLFAVCLLGIVTKRFPLSRFSFFSAVLFLALHTLGARYLYSYTPYDEWSTWLLGIRISELFGWTRNNYDRIVHFSYGLLMVIPIHEFECRHLRISRRLAAILAVECILATSAGISDELIYEITKALWNENSRKLLDNGHAKGKVIGVNRGAAGAVDVRLRKPIGALCITQRQKLRAPRFETWAQGWRDENTLGAAARRQAAPISGIHAWDPNSAKRNPGGKVWCNLEGFDQGQGLAAAPGHVEAGFCRKLASKRFKLGD